MNKLTKVAILALTAAGFASISASAQNVNSGALDLILGFQVDDGTNPGATSNLEVDLGPASNFTTTTALETLPQLSVADLTSVYGTNWASRGDLEFGIAGVTNGTLVTFDMTDSGTPAESSNLSAPYGAISGLSGGINSATQTSNSTSAGVVPTTQGNSFSSEENGANGDYNYFNPTGSTQTLTSGSGASINLFSFAQAGGKTPPLAPELGTFSLSSSGVLTYVGINPTATPEPSAYALGICAVLLFLVLKRRHSVA